MVGAEPDQYVCSPTPDLSLKTEARWAGWLDWAEGLSLTWALTLPLERGPWEEGTYAYPGKGSHHVHALPGTLQFHHQTQAPLQGLWACECWEAGQS